MIPPCYVITLNDTLGKQGEELKAIGLNPIPFKGVDSRKDEHLLYTDYVDQICLHTCPKSVIGCGLSHILLARKIYYTGASVAIIMEDDAFPLVTNIDDEIHKVLQEVPDDWEIIKLHFDSPWKNNTNKTGILPGSGAAYIINRKGMETMMNTRLKGHIDMQQGKVMKVYKTKVNLFRTDEANSTNRIQIQSPLTTFLDSNVSRGEGNKTWSDALSYKIFRIPNTDIEFNALHSVIFWIFVFVCIIFKFL
jgi:GR25 family glycosyltransferase involved in LPS biosynthesis